MKHQLNVHNIKCGGCANSIKSKLEKLEGIKDVEVSTETGAVQFYALDPEAKIKVSKVLADMGYPEDDPSIAQTAKSYVSCMIGRMK
jgi:copper chaperone